MAGNGGEGRVISVPLAIVISIVGISITAVTTFYGARDQSLSQARAEIEAAKVQMRQEMRDRYVPLTDFADYRASTKSDLDQKYYSLMIAIQRLGSRLK